MTTRKTDVKGVEADVAILRVQLKLMARTNGIAHAVSVAASLLGELLINLRAGCGSDGVQISEQVLDHLCKNIRNDQAGTQELTIELGRPPQ